MSSESAGIDYSLVPSVVAVLKTVANLDWSVSRICIEC